MTPRAHRIITIALAPILYPMKFVVGMWGYWKARKERPEDA